jgi:PAS domain S-box-containing protein
MDQSLDKARRLKFWTEDPRVLGIVQNVADGVVGIDSRGHVELFNAAAERLFGYQAGEVMGRNVKLLMPPEYGEHHDAFLQHYLETGRRHIIGVGREVAGRRKDGSVFPMYLSVGEIQRPDYRGFIGIVHDLSAQKAAEQELAEAGELLQSILDSMPSSVVGVDPQGRVTHWNRAAGVAQGLSAEQAIGRPFAELFPFLDLETDEITRAVQEGRPLSRERRQVPQAGEVRYVDLMAFPLHHPSSGAVIRMDDVTERVRIEEMMVQTEKMMSVGGLAAGMAHEINNPLGIVSQACQNLQRRLSGDMAGNVIVAQELGLDLQRMRQYLERRDIFQFIDGMREATERASRIVSDMLAYSRRSASSFVNVNLNQLIDTVLRLANHDYDLRKSYDFRRIEITREGLETPDQVMCEEMAVEQVLLNLLRNAAQAMGTGPELLSPRIRLSVLDEGDWIRLEVADNGPGMSADVAHRLFEPFFTTKPVGIGTGLGLSVAYFIVTEQHQGTMSVETAPGQGARFVIRLPRAGKP